jgi:hypothetical protein
VSGEAEAVAGAADAADAAEKEGAALAVGLAGALAEIAWPPWR